MKTRKRRKAGTMYDPNALLKKGRLRMNEAAELLDVHENTVRRWLENGKLTGVRTGGLQWRIRTMSLKKYL